MQFERRFKLPVNGLWYSVGIGSVEQFKLSDLDEAEGVCVKSLSHIIIREDVPDYRRLSIFCHELIHACFGELSDDTYCVMTRCPIQEQHGSEEALASYLGPILAAALDLRQYEKALRGPITLKARK